VKVERVDAREMAVVVSDNFVCLKIPTFYHLSKAGKVN
jgi:hypothetical protein